MKSTAPASVDEYIAGFPDDVQTILQRIRAVVKKAAPEAEETIKYAIPTFRLQGNLVHFAAYKHHIGFYPTPSGISTFEAELAPYKKAKGSAQFPLTQPIPYELIEKMVVFRMQENRAKSKR
ncbi:iron chaperone [Siphonobacter sp.]|uniref:iron chaperone n=1 Tax=Siphonobacter sp. TaxID=1869184 RepID=UPI003B3B3169